MSVSNFLISVGFIVPILLVVAVIYYIRLVMTVPITKKFKLIVAVWISLILVSYFCIWVLPMDFTLFVSVISVVLSFCLCSYEANLLQ